jgi:hypothetical protein
MFNHPLMCSCLHRTNQIMRNGGLRNTAAFFSWNVSSFLIDHGR